MATQPPKTAFVQVARKFHVKPDVVAEVGAVIELPFSLAAEMISCGRGLAHEGPAAPAPKAKAEKAPAEKAPAEKAPAEKAPA